MGKKVQRGRNARKKRSGNNNTGATATSGRADIFREVAMSNATTKMKRNKKGGGSTKKNRRKTTNKKTLSSAYSDDTSSSRYQQEEEEEEEKNNIVDPDLFFPSECKYQNTRARLNNSLGEWNPLKKNFPPLSKLIRSLTLFADPDIKRKDSNDTDVVILDHQNLLRHNTRQNIRRRQSNDSRSYESETFAKSIMRRKGTTGSVEDSDYSFYTTTANTTAISSTNSNNTRALVLRKEPWEEFSNSNRSINSSRFNNNNDGIFLNDKLYDDSSNSSKSQRSRRSRRKNKKGKLSWMKKSMKRGSGSGSRRWSPLKQRNNSSDSYSLASNSSERRRRGRWNKGGSIRSLNRGGSIRSISSGNRSTNSNRSSIWKKKQSQNQGNAADLSSVKDRFFTSTGRLTRRDRDIEEILMNTSYCGGDGFWSVGDSLGCSYTCATRTSDVKSLDSFRTKKISDVKSLDSFRTIHKDGLDKFKSKRMTWNFAAITNGQEEHQQQRQQQDDNANKNIMLSNNASFIESRNQHSAANEYDRNNIESNSDNIKSLTQGSARQIAGTNTDKSGGNNKINMYADDYIDDDTLTTMESIKELEVDALRDSIMAAENAERESNAHHHHHHHGGGFHDCGVSRLTDDNVSLLSTDLYDSTDKFEITPLQSEEIQIPIEGNPHWLDLKSLTDEKHDADDENTDVSMEIQLRPRIYQQQQQQQQENSSKQTHQEISSEGNPYWLNLESNHERRSSLANANLNHAGKYHENHRSDISLGASTIESGYGDLHDTSHGAFGKPVEDYFANLKTTPITAANNDQNFSHSNDTNQHDSNKQNPGENNGHHSDDGSLISSLALESHYSKSTKSKSDLSVIASGHSVAKVSLRYFNSEDFSTERNPYWLDLKSNKPRGRSRSQPQHHINKIIEQCDSDYYSSSRNCDAISLASTISSTTHDDRSVKSDTELVSNNNASKIMPVYAPMNLQLVYSKSSSNAGADVEGNPYWLFLEGKNSNICNNDNHISEEHQQQQHILDETLTRRSSQLRDPDEDSNKGNVPMTPPLRTNTSGGYYLTNRTKVLHQAEEDEEVEESIVVDSLCDADQQIVTQKKFNSDKSGGMQFAQAPEATSTGANTNEYSDKMVEGVIAVNSTNIAAAQENTNNFSQAIVEIEAGNFRTWLRRNSSGEPNNVEIASNEEDVLLDLYDDLITSLPTSSGIFASLDAKNASSDDEQILSSLSAPVRPRTGSEDDNIMDDISPSYEQNVYHQSSLNLQTEDGAPTGMPPSQKTHQESRVIRKLSLRNHNQRSSRENMKTWMASSERTSLESEIANRFYQKSGSTSSSSRESDYPESVVASTTSSREESTSNVMSSSRRRNSQESIVSRGNSQKNSQESEVAISVSCRSIGVSSSRRTTLEPEVARRSSQEYGVARRASRELVARRRATQENTFSKEELQKSVLLAERMDSNRLFQQYPTGIDNSYPSIGKETFYSSESCNESKSIPFSSSSSSERVLGRPHDISDQRKLPKSKSNPIMGRKENKKCNDIDKRQQKRPSTSSKKDEKKQKRRNSLFGRIRRKMILIGKKGERNINQ